MRPLLLVHGILALALVGSAIHHTVSCVPWLWGRPGAPRRANLHGSLLAALFLAAFLLGLLLYPSYKVDVRLGVFDAPRASGGLGLPWVSSIFDIKEHLVALVLPAVIAIYAFGRAVGPEGLRERRGLYVGLSLFTSIALVVSALIALWVTSIRAVP